MVRMQYQAPKARSTYYLKPGQTLANTKPSERELALIVPKSVFEGYYENAYESERFALLAQREAKRLAALKEATYQMSKTWEDTAQNIQKHRRQELLNRRKVEEAERIKFTKEMALKNAEERAKVVKQAKELLLYRKPQCRLISRALFVSECYRELNEQLESQKCLRDRQEKLKAEEARLIEEDVEKFRLEEQRKHEERMNKLQAHNRELEKQIRENEANLKSIEESIRKAEIEDRKNMSKEIEEINEREVQRLLDKKERLKRMFLEAIEEKKEQELRIKREEEFQRKSMKIYQDNKVQVDKTRKEKAKAEIEKKIRKLEIVGKRFRRIADRKQRANEKEDKKKEEADKEIEEKSKRELLELIEKNRQKKEKARLESLENMKKYEEQSKLRKKEEMDLKLWETLQRYKRDEFNKEWNLQKLEEEKSKKMNYGKILKKQMEENDVKREKAAAEADDSAIINEMINKENEKVLAFGERVLEESRGVRPIHLIVKTMEGLKKDMGLIPLTKAENSYEVSSAPKKKRGRRTFCNRPVNEENAFYFA